MIPMRGERNKIRRVLSSKLSSCIYLVGLFLWFLGNCELISNPSWWSSWFKSYTSSGVCQPCGKGVLVVQACS